jgi:membrane protease YdiL (CAAX protease family)
MSFEKGWRVFLGSFLLLIISYLVYSVRYPIWQFFTSIEPIFIVLILSYSIVLAVALVLIKKDVKKSLHEVFKFRGYRMILAGFALAFLFQALWFLIITVMGSRLEFTSFFSLRGYENYAFYSLPIAFALYVFFSVFGAFSEEVAYRGYVQLRISKRYGLIVGIFVSSLLFSLQHIQFFQTTWIETFFQNQFIYVFLFGLFVGYLFLKSGENIWSVFVFHSLMNIFNISLPFEIENPSIGINTFATVVSFLILFLILQLLGKSRRNEAME